MHVGTRRRCRRGSTRSPGAMRRKRGTVAGWSSGPAPRFPEQPGRLKRARRFANHAESQTRFARDVEQRVRAVGLIQDPQQGVLALIGALPANRAVQPAGAEPGLALGLEVQVALVALDDVHDALARLEA